MAQVVSKCSSLDDIGIQTTPRLRLSREVLRQALCQSPTYLGHFQGMRQPVVKDVPLASRSYLGDPGQPTELWRVQNPIAVPLVRVARIRTASGSDPIRTARH
jgi:hypothetical protein